MKVHLSDKDPINFMFKTFNVFIQVNIYKVCIYVYIMNDAFKHLNQVFCNCKKKFFGASNIVQISGSGP